MQFPVFGLIVTDDMFPECVCMRARLNDFTKFFQKREGVGDVSMISFYCNLSSRIHLAVINCFKKSVFVPQLFCGARQSIANTYWKM